MNRSGVIKTLNRVCCNKNNRQHKYKYKNFQKQNKMKKIIDWVKSSNHYYHIGLLAALSLVIMSIGAFEFGANGFWTNVWQTAKFGLMTGIVIEAYQAITTKSINIRNTLGDLLADVIGLVLGLVVYGLLAWGAPTSAIVLYILAAISIIWAIIYKEMRTWLVAAFLGFAMVGFSLFVYA